MRKTLAPILFFMGIVVVIASIALLFEGQWVDGPIMMVIGIILVASGHFMDIWASRVGGSEIKVWVFFMLGSVWLLGFGLLAIGEEQYGHAVTAITLGVTLFIAGVKKYRGEDL